MNEISIQERPSAANFNVNVVQGIARDTHTQAHIVKRIYEEELAELARGAKLTRFLSVLAGRRVRLRLREH